MRVVSVSNQPTSVLGDFSWTLLDVLKSSGWTTPTPAQVLECIEYIKHRGFELNNAAQLAIEMFGQANCLFRGSLVTGITFSFKDHFSIFTKTDLWSLEQLLQEAPCPIGGGAGYTIVVCPSGKAALLHETWTFLVSCHSLADLMESIVLNDLSNCHVYRESELKLYGIR